MMFLVSIDDVRITRQGFEKRVVSQDLQLWLSNVSFLPIFPWYSLCAEWLSCVILELSSCRHHPVVRSLPSWLVLEGRWVASWLSLCPSLSVSLPLSHFSFGNSLWFRCKRYNFQHSLIRKASKRHCNEYWNVFHETAIVNNWCLCLFFLYKSSCILKTAA